LRLAAMAKLVASDARAVLEEVAPSEHSGQGR
jgi:hypothetical protein